MEIPTVPRQVVVADPLQEGAAGGGVAHDQPTALQQGDLLVQAEPGLHAHRTPNVRRPLRI